jgi:RNA polymerase-binding transcription factor
MDPESTEARIATARLQKERERLERQIAEVDTEYRADGSITTGGDAAADTTEADAQLELKSELGAQIAEVDAALGRITAGTYGLDEVTGEPIDPARLEAFPTARTNI